MKKLLVIGHVWPEPSTTAAGNRMLQLLDVFLEKHYQITFACTAAKTPYSITLEDLGVREATITLNHDSFDHFAKNLDPEIVLFDRFMVEEQFGWRVAMACPDAVQILNTEDLHSLREFRETCVKTGKGFTEEEWRKQDKTKREMASIYRVDLALLISPFETHLLEKSLQVPPRLLLYLPFMYTPVKQETVGEWPTFHERNDFVAFGNGKHPPNTDAFSQLKTVIWPLIRKALPEAKLHIYGAYLPQRILEMHAPGEGFWIHGWVEDLAGVVQKTRLLLAPLRFGAGLKGKLAFAMQQGTPNVTTPTGAEGMPKDLPWAGEIAATPETFAQKAVTLYHDAEKWQEKQQNGVVLLNKAFHKEQHTAHFFTVLESIQQELSAHRNRNFIGALLRHQSMAASKYMGKWIQEKNKNKSEGS